MRHPYYMGIVRYRSVLYQGKHEPLVSPEIWQQVQVLLGANNLAGDKQRDHPHYLKGSVYCGSCGSRLIVTKAKGRRGGIYPYFVCIGRHQRRNTCTQRAILIDRAEEAVAAHYATVRLTREQANEVRDFVREELLQLRTEVEKERGTNSGRLRALENERKKLLDAHYADAVPLDLLKTEQARIAAEVKVVQERLATLEGNYAAAEANLNKAIALVQDCEAAYLNASDRLRRQFNQAFFKRLLIDDEYEVTIELAPPFDILLGEDMRQAAALRAEDALRSAMDGVVREHRTSPEVHEPELALVGTSTTTNPSRSTTSVGGLKKETMVGTEGLEPSLEAF